MAGQWPTQTLPAVTWKEYDCGVPMEKSATRLGDGTP